MAETKEVHSEPWLKEKKTISNDKTFSKKKSGTAASAAFNTELVK